MDGEAIIVHHMPNAHSDGDSVVLRGWVPDLEREIRELKELSESVSAINESLVIACECSDRSCTEMVTISHDEYEAIRANPRHFAVLPGHVYADVESVVQESDAYVVVEKQGIASAGAEILDAPR
jgi:5-bromo-4-chloroindolyl phosphate hydrolysis protein